MKKLKFKNIEDFACEVFEAYDAMQGYNDDGDISIIAKYTEAKQLIKELIILDFEPQSIVIHEEEYEGYYDEYIISIVSIDGKSELWCEPMKRENGYLTDCSTITYVLDNCSSVCLERCIGDIIVEIHVCTEDCDCDEECKDELNCNGDCCNCPYAETLDETEEKETIVEEKDNTFEHTFKSDDGNTTLTIKGNMNPYELLQFVDNMEERFSRMNKMAENLFKIFG